MNRIVEFISKNIKERNGKKILGSMIIIAIFAIFLAVGYVKSRPVNVENNKDIFVEDSQNDKEKNTKNKINENITVYINGEIKRPGVYELKRDSRLEELVRISGGFTNSADSYKLNMAKKLKDEDYIYVDKKNEKDVSSKNSVQTPDSGTDSEGVVNINNASKEELKTIPGVGDATAQNIIDYREQNGGFSSIEDIKNVDRIGDKTFEKLKNKIDVR